MKVASLTDKIKTALSNHSIDIEEMKEEVWRDLSMLYYKYELPEQKKAFRLVIQDVAQKIAEGKWDSVYKKLYREEKKDARI